MTWTSTEAATEELPDGTLRATPDTLVLLNRDLRADTAADALSRFGEDRWNLNPAVMEDHLSSLVLAFATFPPQLKQDCKFYVWQLLNHPGVRTVRGKTRRPAVLSIVQGLAPLREVAHWFAAHQVTAFCQVTPELLDRLLDDLNREDLSPDESYARFNEVRRLWANRNLLPASMRLPEAPPWGGEEASDLLRRPRTPSENRTRRINETTMQLLLGWAIRFVEDFADDITAAYLQKLTLNARSPENRRALGTQSTAARPRHRSGELAAKTAAYLDELRARGDALPGIRRPDGRLEIRWRHLSAILDTSPNFEHTRPGRMIVESGLPIGEHTYLGTINGTLDGKPWRCERITYEEAAPLARILATACFIVIAYLSGARPGEVLNLRRGCITHDQAAGMWLMEGLYFKGATDANGARIPEGRVREDPWVVIDVVARAVAVMERLHQRPLLFPRALIPPHRQWTILKRQGDSRSARAANRDLEAFVTWVNSFCASTGRTDVIPEDPDGPITASRFRRTLAWFIRRRPRGLIAASIQYGHAHTRMLQGYAGSYESGFPDECAFEDWLLRLEGLAEDEQRLTQGEHVSGPAADAYRHRVTAASREFAGRVLTRDKQARELLSNPLLQIHHGRGMTCVFNPATAACQLNGSVDDPRVTPDLDDCRPKCPNLARTDRDISVVRQERAALAAIIDDPLAPPIRLARELHELDRLTRILDEHEEAVR